MLSNSDYNTIAFSLYSQKGIRCERNNFSKFGTYSTILFVSFTLEEETEQLWITFKCEKAIYYKDSNGKRIPSSVATIDSM